MQENGKNNYVNQKEKSGHELFIFFLWKSLLKLFKTLDIPPFLFPGSGSLFTFALSNYA